ncbi:MAG: HAD family hydrolase [Tumebacillaceae bacterium]
MTNQSRAFEAVIFDVDGTLFQTEKVAIPAFKRTFEALKQKGLYHGDIPSEDKITSVFGMTIPELWETLLPDASMDVRDQANELLAHEELTSLENGVGEPYPGVKETLQCLKDEGYKIYTASNGEERYVATVIEALGLNDYFTRLYSAGEYKTEKKEDLVALLLKQENITRAVMIGDRRSDITAGLANNLHTVGCDFGFAKDGELKDAHDLIQSFDDLRTCLQHASQATART